MKPDPVQAPDKQPSATPSCADTWYGVVTNNGKDLTAPDGTSFKKKYTGKTGVVTFDCKYGRKKNDPCSNCNVSVHMYPDGRCSYVNGHSQHKSSLCYTRNNAKVPDELDDGQSPTVVNICEEMLLLTDKLALGRESLSKKQIWAKVKALKQPYLDSGTPIDAMSEKQVHNRVQNVRSEMSQSDKAIKKLEKDHGPTSEGGTGLLQHSSSFADVAVNLFQRMMVFTLPGLLMLLGDQIVSLVLFLYPEHFSHSHPLYSLTCTLMALLAVYHTPSTNVSSS